MIKVPKVTGKTAVGSTLTATPGSWNQRGLTFGYQWLRDGVAVPGATAPKFELTSADVGHRLAVQVTATRVGAAPGVAQSAPTAMVTRAKATLTTSLADTTPQVRSSVRLAVRVGTEPSGVPISGQVRVLVDGKLVRAAMVNGALRTTLRFSTAGAHRVLVRFLGSSAVAPVSTLRVIRAHR